MRVLTALRKGSAVLVAVVGLFGASAAMATSANALPNDPWGITDSNGGMGQRGAEAWGRQQEDAARRAIGQYYSSPQGQEELKDAVCSVVGPIDAFVGSVTWSGTVIHVDGPNDKSLEDMIKRRIAERFAQMKKNPLRSAAGISLTIVATACDIREDVKRYVGGGGDPQRGGGSAGGGGAWGGGVNRDASFRDTGTGAADGPGGGGMMCTKEGSRAVCRLQKH